MITEKEYIKKTDIFHRKKFAQFFTPELIANFMAEWILQDLDGHANILEPAFGLGIFSRFMFKMHKSIKVKGYEVDNKIFQYALSNISEMGYDISLDNDNYLTSSWDNKYDGIICNPPYLKFHDYDNSTLIPLVNSKLKINLNGFTNIYTLFLLKSIYQLKEGGRLAYIIPSEFLNSDYGVEVKRVLLNSGTLRHVIIVNYTQCAFDDALTTSCILLCQKTNNSKIIKFSSVDDTSKLTAALSNFTITDSSLLDPEQKWKKYYEKEQSSKYNNLVPFSTFAKVSRGIATGSNAFFTFNKSKQNLYNLPNSCFYPCICHSVDVNNPIFTYEDYEHLKDKDKTVLLFNGTTNGNNRNVINYIRLGEEQGIDKKYLTASRSPWYALENRKPSPIWVSVFNRKGLRFVRNKANVYNLTTFHCVYNLSDINTDILFAYLITNVAKDIFLDNSRQYGNGLIKFEPNDLNKGYVVDLRMLSTHEKEFISKVYGIIQQDNTINMQCINLLNDFFEAKYTIGHVNINNLEKRLDSFNSLSPIVNLNKERTISIKQLNLYNLFEQYADSPIVDNYMVQEGEVLYSKSQKNYLHIDPLRNCLIGLVKRDNFDKYIEQTANIYYSGKKFPSTVSLDKLYYFMPYLKGKGIRDLYLIKKVRVGARKEGQIDVNKADLRLIFEIEFVKQLFNDYHPVDLKIWRTFTDTIIKEILDI